MDSLWDPHTFLSPVRNRIPLIDILSASILIIIAALQDPHLSTMEEQRTTLRNYFVKRLTLPTCIDMLLRKRDSWCYCCFSSILEKPDLTCNGSVMHLSSPDGLGGPHQAKGCIL
jgi:hypothetical protein